MFGDLEKHILKFLIKLKGSCQKMDLERENGEGLAQVHEQYEDARHWEQEDSICEEVKVQEEIVELYDSNDEQLMPKQHGLVDEQLKEDPMEIEELEKESKQSSESNKVFNMSPNPILHISISFNNFIISFEFLRSIT